MKIEIPFNENSFIRANEVNFKNLWKPHLKKNRSRWVMGVFFLVIAAFQLYFENYLGLFFLGTAFMVLVNYFSYLYQYKKVKSNLKKKVVENSEWYELGNQNLIWILEEEFFEHIDFKQSIKIKWPFMKGYRILEDILFLDMEPSNGFSFLLDKSGVSPQEWAAILEIVKSKLKPTPQNWS